MIVFNKVNECYKILNSVVDFKDKKNFKSLLFVTFKVINIFIYNL